MPKYLDGIYQMRRSVTKQKLPSSRLISLNLVENIKYIIYKNDISHALVTWTDFIANDLSHTATSGMSKYNLYLRTKLSKLYFTIGIDSEN